MYAVAFETRIEKGTVKLPEEFAHFDSQQARVVLLLEENALPASTAQPLDFGHSRIAAFKERDAVAWQREQRNEW